MPDKEENIYSDEHQRLAAHFEAHGFENCDQRALNTLGREKAIKAEINNK